MAYGIYHLSMSCYLQHKEGFYTWLIRLSILANNVRFLFHRNNRLWLPIIVESLLMILLIAVIHQNETERKLLKYLKLYLPLNFLLHMQTLSIHEIPIFCQNFLLHIIFASSLRPSILRRVVSRDLS